MTKLVITSDTVFKQAPVQSVELPDSEKASVKAGTEFDLLAYLIERDHVKVTISPSVKERNTWTAYKGHVELVKDDGRKLIGKYKEDDPLPPKVNLPIPYFSQLDNQFRPYGTCNVTSVAMCLYYYGVRPKRQHVQLEDELFKYVESKGWDRHVHDHLRKVFIAYGIYDDFETEASWQRVKRHLANQNPVIISGRFTKSGHIIVLRGYDEHGWRVNDPYGEYFSEGYRTSLSGENLHYSYDLIERVSYSGSEHTWAHFPEKR